jgi:hypothetical protein
LLTGDKSESIATGTHIVIDCRHKLEQKKEQFEKRYTE